jgi:hypothetical protein
MANNNISGSNYRSGASGQPGENGVAALSENMAAW